MSYSLYFVLRQISMSILLFLAIHMILTSVPKRARKSQYHRSLRIMGAAFMIVPLSCFIYTHGNRFDLDPHIGPAISLTAYFATFILMSVAFLTLLGRRFNKAVMSLVIAVIVIYPMPLWLSIMSKQRVIIDNVITASYSLFVALIIILIITILRNYNRIRRELENYYSDDVAVCVDWVSKSIKMLIGLSVVCAAAPLFFACPLWLRFIFMSYGALCYLHIHYGYRRMLFNITERFIEANISDVIEDKSSDDFEGVMSNEVVNQIQKSLDEWSEKRLYTQKGVTINDVAKSIKTNRTYLSKYINTTYRCSFKVWVTQLRIEEAKRELENSPDLTISSIAESIGFASVESFVHIFTRVEGVSPSKWREEKTRKKDI